MAANASFLTSTSDKPPNGIIPASVMNNVQAKSKLEDAASKSQFTKYKTVIRCLPPGLTLSELMNVLGTEWTVGQGKVSWMLYKPGKVSKDLSKPSRPARAYLQLTEQLAIAQLAEKIRHSTLIDAHNTANDPTLASPPSLEYAPCSRVPLAKRRNDARQGTIDQDPEFIDFLQSLTDPITKPSDANQDHPIAKDGRATVTPLIQHLRDKKAAREKNLPIKAARHTRTSSKELIDPKSVSKASTDALKSAIPSIDKKSARSNKVESTSKDQAKTRRGESNASARLQSTVERTARPNGFQPPKDRPIRKSDDVPARSAAARMIQRDLGLRGRAGFSRRGDRLGTESARASSQLASANSSLPPADTSSQQNLSSPTTLKETSSVIAKGPTTISGVGSGNGSAANNPRPTSLRSSSVADAVSSTATRGFLKHANSSQGITEALISSALAVFGQLDHVEIDKRKGFAYVEFAVPNALQAAIAASPVKVAQGSVQVLERKDRTSKPISTMASIGPPNPQRGLPVERATSMGLGFRGGRGRGRGRARGVICGPVLACGTGDDSNTNADVSQTPTAPTVLGTTPNQSLEAWSA